MDTRPQRRTPTDRERVTAREQLRMNRIEDLLLLVPRFVSHYPPPPPWGVHDESTVFAPHFVFAAAVICSFVGQGRFACAPLPRRSSLA